MPIYEYRCECENEREVILPLGDIDQPQVCKCGKVMQRRMSVSSFVMKQTGSGMALDSLNSKGGGFPSRGRRTEMQQKAFEGI